MLDSIVSLSFLFLIVFAMVAFISTIFYRRRRKRETDPTLNQAEWDTLTVVENMEGQKQNNNEFKLFDQIKYEKPEYRYSKDLAALRKDLLKFRGVYAAKFEDEKKNDYINIICEFEDYHNQEDLIEETVKNVLLKCNQYFRWNCLYSN